MAIYAPTPKACPLTTAKVGKGNDTIFASIFETAIRMAPNSSVLLQLGISPPFENILG